MKKLYAKLPETPGVYLFKGAEGKILYIGKAANLRKRVASYFERPHDYRIERLIGAIKKIDYKKTDTALEALILESELIKKYQPPWNVREKDDKSFLYVEITKERFPRLLLVRGKSRVAGIRYGPFTSASSIREALRIIRKIFPFGLHPSEKIGKFSRPCFEYEIGLCPGTCVGAINHGEYLKNIRNIELLFKGKKKQILKSLKRGMRAAVKALEFEEAETLRRQIFALQHIQDVALIRESEPPIISGESRFRIEGYDISNISGTSAVGSMVVFTNGRPDKNEYRKFKIITIQKADDVGMLKEVLRRRFQNDWPLPNLVLIDGGKGQVNAAKAVLNGFGLKIPILGMAKGPKRKKTEIIGKILQGIDKKILVKVRDEAHRFAISYHKKIRGVKMMF